MDHYDIDEVKAKLSALIQKVILGEEIIVTKDEIPIAKLVPLHPIQGRRKPGSAKGLIWMAPDFDAPLDDAEDCSR